MIIIILEYKTRQTYYIKYVINIIPTMHVDPIGSIYIYIYIYIYILYIYIYIYIYIYAYN